MLCHVVYHRDQHNSIGIKSASIKWRYNWTLSKNWLYNGFWSGLFDDRGTVHGGEWAKKVITVQNFTEMTIFILNHEENLKPLVNVKKCLCYTTLTVFACNLFFSEQRWKYQWLKTYSAFEKCYSKRVLKWNTLTILRVYSHLLSYNEVSNVMEVIQSVVREQEPILPNFVFLYFPIFSVKIECF